MERLTYVKKPSQFDRGKYPTKYTSRHTFQEVVARLSAYEDTGLGPEEITTEPYGCVFYCNRKCNLDGDFCAEGPGCSHEISADTAKHLLELAQAEKDGRLVVLDEPRKPLVWGDDNHDSVLCPNCNHDLMGGFLKAGSCEKSVYQCPYCGSSVDGTKALTREEAEEALKKREETDNEAD